jgi:hypothetical protein
MEDKRKYNGGHKTAGRKSKSEEILFDKYSKEYNRTLCMGTMQQT